MRRLAARTAAIAVGAAAGCGLGGGVAVLPAAAHARGAAETAYPANLLVYAQEWSVWPSRTRIVAASGTIDVQLWNRGEDEHDLQVRRRSIGDTMVGPVLGRISTTPAGAVHTAVWHLKPGRYEIYCAMPGHYAMGMHANISVVR